MRFWFAAGSEVPLYEQLATQVRLAIVSGELREGERLPSTRELARRFGVHANTISAGYKRLEQQGWAEQRRGSGVYVRRQRTRAGGSNGQERAQARLEEHIAGFFRAVRELGLADEVVREQVLRWLESPRPDHVLVVDPEPAVREILAAEIGPVVKSVVQCAALETCAASQVLRGALPVCRPSQAKAVRAALPAGVELVTLKIRSANRWLGQRLELADGVLIGVVSHWPEFLETARIMLAAAGVDADAVVWRDARVKSWQHGLEATAGVLCDAHTAARREMPKGLARVVFGLVADESLQELAARGL